jgi:uncharacterized protein (DUF488 family)
MSIKIVSLGYERRSIEELISILINLNVKKLVDVRITPISRKKDYNKRALSVKLEEAGIEYIHLKEAGNPYYKQNSDIQKCLGLYSNYLQNNPRIILNIANELSRKSSAVLCYEREYSICHRNILLNKLQQQDNTLEVVNIV